MIGRPVNGGRSVEFETAEERADVEIKGNGFFDLSFLEGGGGNPDLVDQSKTEG